MHYLETLELGVEGEDEEPAVVGAEAGRHKEEAVAVRGMRRAGRKREERGLAMKVCMKACMCVGEYVSEGECGR